MKVLFVTAEVFPLAKTGGLADVSRALPIALAERGVDVRILMPGYESALAQIGEMAPITPLPPVLGVGDATLMRGTLPGSNIPVALIHSPSLYQRSGSLYLDEDGKPWADNAHRFAYLCQIASLVAMDEAGLNWAPDVVHGNDWHTGLLPLLLAERGTKRPHTVFTVHNMAFQGNFSADSLGETGIDRHYLSDGSVEFYGWLSFLKAGLGYADRVTTVSPTYAREILTRDFGCGMEGVLKNRGPAFSGILNGIDPATWDPSQDPDIAAHYSQQNISGKRLCKASLQSEAGLSLSPATPLIGYVSRLTQQKMADIVADSIPDMVQAGAQFILVGEGDGGIEQKFSDMARRFPGQVAVHIGYNEAEAHRLQAGSDILLAPARFEPCGLTQLYALRYGTLPVVRNTGGLADTVSDAEDHRPGHIATGFVFENANAGDFVSAVRRALHFYQEPLRWRRLQLAAMEQNFSWDASAARYSALYQEIAGQSLRPQKRAAPKVKRPAPAANPEIALRSTG